MEPDIDNELRRVFDRSAAELPDEPFLSDTRRWIAAAQLGRRVVRICAQVLVVALIALGSPWLIEASELLSRGLEVSFAWASEFLGTPVGIGLAAFGLASAFFYRRLRYARF